MPIIIEHLCYTYAKGSPFEKKAVNDICFTVADGEFIGIIGQTGCGKSTLIRLMAGLMKPDSGSISINGSDINKSNYDRRQLRRKVGVVFQYPEYQLFETTVEKDVAFGLKKIKSAALSPQEIDGRVKWALELVGFEYEAVRSLSPFGLSGGEKRKIAIAGVLAMRPEMLILDEPIAGLDPEARNEFLHLLRKLNKKGTTVLMVSHNMDALCECAERILVLNNGMLIKDDTPEEVFSDVEYMNTLNLGVSKPRKIAWLLENNGFTSYPGIIRYDDLLQFLLSALQQPDDEKNQDKRGLS